MPTPLARKIVRLIEEHGPITVADYFAICLADPEYGYYRAREPFGRAGDFVTAPEISQMFGEMIGVFLVSTWQAHGAPAPLALVEIGPGRGTLMADALRTIERLAPAMFAATDVHLVETSARLSDVQRQTLLRYKEKITWHDDFGSVPESFTLLVANELFDAIPLRQFVKTATGFRERMVRVNETGALEFAIGATGIDPGLLPDQGRGAPEGTIFEAAPARSAVMLSITERLVRHGGTALIIDYGHLQSGYGDTLQAVYRHEYDPPLARPGEADLTSHVDFEALAMAALAAGGHVHRPLPQGDFLVALGLLERAGALGAGKDRLTQAGIEDAVNRLAGEGAGAMGRLFKVLCVSGTPLALVPFDHVAN
mgnify:CR=1 FL=1|jgi:Uncharacterized conserved protein